MIHPGIHRLAAAGNAAAVVLLVLLLSSAPVLLREQGSDEPPHAVPTGPGVARRVVLVVIDGLRANTAIDCSVMPHLAGLAQRGGHGIARVETLIPSTIAGITTLVSGRVAPPISFLSDFRAAPADHGGILAAIAAAGGRSFVAGPRLWTDLYGQWIAGHRTVPALGGDDEELVTAAVAALGDARYRLIVLHVGETDDAAHQHGAISPQYARAASTADRAIRRLIEAITPDDCIIVTSDHGNTDAGGHAGPEPQVLNTPLVVFGPGVPQGPIAPLRQRDIPQLVVASLGLEWPTPQIAPAPGRRSWVWPTLACAMAVAGAICVWSSLEGQGTGRAPATVLNVAFGVSLLPVLVGYHDAAVLLSVASLLVAVAIVRGSWRSAPPLLAAVFVGLLLGWIRMAYAIATAADSGTAIGQMAVVVGLACAVVAAAILRPASAPVQGIYRHLPVGLGGAMLAYALGQFPLAALSVVALGVGWSIGHAMLPSRPAVAGMALAIAPAALDLALGRTLSLSSIDVRAAHAMAQTPHGLPVAVLIVAFVQALPTAGLLLGLAPAIGRCTPQAIGRLTATAAAVLTAQAAFAAVLLWWWPPDQAPVVPSLSLAMLLRSGAQIIFIFLGLAAVLGFGVRVPKSAPAAHAPAPAFLQSGNMPLACNIDQRGRRLRLIMGLCCAVGAVLLWILASALASTALAITGVFFAIAAVGCVIQSLFGYCVVRAARARWKSS